ncbi:MAG: hypothetical protein WCK70_03900 [Chloroflexales bacterium]
MAFVIRLTNDAKRDILALRAADRRKVLDALDIHLRYEPTKESKSRIKRLRRMETPQYRLRVDNIRVFYDITGGDVEIIAVIDKAAAAAWLAREGILAEETSHADDYAEEEPDAND